MVGGLEMQNQAKALARRPHVVVATPGRLKVSPLCVKRAVHSCSTHNGVLNTRTRQLV